MYQEDHRGSLENTRPTLDPSCSALARFTAIRLPIAPRPTNASLSCEDQYDPKSAKRVTHMRWVGCIGPAALSKLASTKIHRSTHRENGMGCGVCVPDIVSSAFSTGGVLGAGSL